jgi:transglutaminase-like putative cysteine protease
VVRVERRAAPRRGWQALPRDSRDTLFLLGVIAWTIVPHLPHLPAWCIALTAVVLLWRGQLALRNAALPGRWVLVAVLALAAGLTLFTFRTLFGKEPGVTMAVVLMALKTLELRARRDAFVVFFLGFFLVLTHFLYSQSIGVAAAMLVSVWGLLTALVLAHMPVGQPSLKQAAALAARTALLGAPVMALLFVLFPRIGPLWGVPQDGSGTGLSNSMRMGSVAEVALDDRIALRLRFEGPPPPPASLYLRGPVFTRFDGENWTAAAPRIQSEPRMRTELHQRGAPVRYEMTLEPQRLASVPTLEATAERPQVEGLPIYTRGDLQWVSERPVVERVRLSAVAYPQFRYGPLEREPREDLDLPPGFNPRTLEWAAALRRDPRYAGADARTLARAVLQQIRTGGYTYTLAPGEYTGRDAIDQFWFDRKEGFCEHFAAAFVVIMRALDVPARVVTGYQGAEPLPVDDYYVVRQSAAHAWAEYWQAGSGWERADPTAAVAPERIQRSVQLRPQPGLVAGAIATVSPELLEGLRDAWEAVNNRWNQWVLNYARGNQIDLLKDLGFASPSWEDVAMLLIASLSSLALVGALWAWWDRHRVDPWTRQMQRLRSALGAIGIAAAAHDPPRRLAQRVTARFGEAGAPLVALLERLERQRYGREAMARPPAGFLREFVAASVRLRTSAPR